MALTADTRPVASHDPAGCLHTFAPAATSTLGRVHRPGQPTPCWCGISAERSAAPSATDRRCHGFGELGPGGDVYLRLWLRGSRFDYVVSATALDNLLHGWMTSRWCTLEVISNPRGE